MGPLRCSHRKAVRGTGRRVERPMDLGNLFAYAQASVCRGPVQKTALDPGLRCFEALRDGAKKRRTTKPHERLVSVSSTPCSAYTSDLSTSSSSTALQRDCSLGGLILRSASRLDAFSGYQIRTLLPSGATGVTTGTQAVRPTRSSRTKVGASQASYAHSR